MDGAVTTGAISAALCIASVCSQLWLLYKRKKASAFVQCLLVTDVFLALGTLSFSVQNSGLLSETKSQKWQSTSYSSLIFASFLHIFFILITSAKQLATIVAPSQYRNVFHKKTSWMTLISAAVFCIFPTLLFLMIFSENDSKPIPKASITSLFEKFVAALQWESGIAFLLASLSIFIFCARLILKSKIYTRLSREEDFLMVVSVSSFRTVMAMLLGFIPFWFGQDDVLVCTVYSRAILLVVISLIQPIILYFTLSENRKQCRIIAEKQDGYKSNQVIPTIAEAITLSLWSAPVNHFGAYTTTCMMARADKERSVSFYQFVRIAPETNALGFLQAPEIYYD